MKIVSAEEMRALDRATTEQAGVPSLTLMENAGAAVAEYVLSNFAQARRILVVCGKGNKGGDGYVAARHLRQRGCTVDVLVLADLNQISGDAKEMLRRVENVNAAAEGDAVSGDRLRGYDLIIDAMLGNGFSPPVREPFESAIAAVNKSGVPVVSIDLPSGVEPDSFRTELPAEAIQPAAIVTFTALKPVHVFACAHIPTALRHIGTPEELVRSGMNMHLITPADYAHIFRPRPRDSNKGRYGHVLVVAGSFGKAGAAAMAGGAALRVGAGLVTVATPRSAVPVIASFMPELMAEPLAETQAGNVSVLALESQRRMMDGKNVIALGPGLSREGEAVQFIRTFVERTEIPLVLDADGLNAFEGKAELLKGSTRTLIVTPHPGEMARLTGKTVAEVQADRVEIARRFAKEHSCFVVLKGEKTVVAEPDGKVWINTTGNPAMSKGGTGDILTGLIAGLLAQRPQDAASCVIAAVNLHGRGGDLVRDEVGEFCLLATDILAALPAAIQQALLVAEDMPE